MAKHYKLIPEKIPNIIKTTIYEDVLHDFASTDFKSVRVEIPKKKPATVHQGLLKAKKAKKEFENIQVVRRGDLIFLRK